jgi:hypothetical protein
MDPMNGSTDQFFLTVSAFLIPIAVSALDAIAIRVGWAWTRANKPEIAASIGAILGVAYGYPPIWEYLNQKPIPLGASPAAFVLGGITAGLAAVGIHAISWHRQARQEEERQKKEETK